MEKFRAKESSAKAKKFGRLKILIDPFSFIWPTSKFVTVFLWAQSFFIGIFSLSFFDPAHSILSIPIGTTVHFLPAFLQNVNMFKSSLLLLLCFSFYSFHFPCFHFNQSAIFNGNSWLPFHPSFILSYSPIKISSPSNPSLLIHSLFSSKLCFSSL
jgi:hypothetical protein